MVCQHQPEECFSSAVSAVPRFCSAAALVNPQPAVGNAQSEGVMFSRADALAPQPVSVMNRCTRQIQKDPIKVCSPAPALRRHPLMPVNESGATRLNVAAQNNEREKPDRSPCSNAAAKLNLDPEAAGSWKTGMQPDWGYLK